MLCKPETWPVYLPSIIYSSFPKSIWLTYFARDHGINGLCSLDLVILLPSWLCHNTKVEIEKLSSTKFSLSYKTNETSCLVRKECATNFSKKVQICTFSKVRTFWEAHKNLCNLPHALYNYLVNVKTMRETEDFFKFCVLHRKSEL